MASQGVIIGACECCGSSSSTTTTGTGTTGTAFDCCYLWDDGFSTYPIESIISDEDACDCGGSNVDVMQSNGDSTFTGQIQLCESVIYEGEPSPMDLVIEIECPGVSSSGSWRLNWTLSHPDPACNNLTGSVDAYSVDCDATSFAICFEIDAPSNACCDGGTGSATLDICMESS
jgi:hypothetical protein